MKYIYLLECLSYSEKRYVGKTADLQNRLKDHNAGKSPHTSKFIPWRVLVAIRFADDQKADSFESYLKSGSGHASARARGKKWGGSKKCRKKKTTAKVKSVFALLEQELPKAEISRTVGTSIPTIYSIIREHQK